jgi:hypothetical protein
MFCRCIEFAGDLLSFSAFIDDWKGAAASLIRRWPPIGPIAPIDRMKTHITQSALARFTSPCQKDLSE